MRTEEELKLAEWLDSYELPDADSQLLERIVQQAKQAKVAEMVILLPCNRRRHASVLAALAVIGFWLGHISLQQQANDTLSQTFAIPVNLSDTVNLDKVILGLESLQEMML